MKLRKAIPEMSASGVVGAYFAYMAATGSEMPVDPLWVVGVGLAMFVALGLYRAWADDGKITIDEITEILGVAREDLDTALTRVEQERAESESAVPQEIDFEDDKTPVIPFPR